jgi:hypothetical protein
VRDATESDDEEGGRSPTRPSAELEADEELQPLQPHQMINPWYCPGKQFFLFKRWCVERNVYSSCESTHPDRMADNRHVRYDRIIGFVRHNQAVMDNNERIAAMYAELRAAPKAQEAFEQKVERFSLFERYVLERWPKDTYCDYLRELERCSSYTNTIVYQKPPEHLVIDWALNLRKDKIKPYREADLVDHVYSTIRVYLASVNGTVQDFAGAGADSPAKAELLANKLREWKRKDVCGQSATFDNLELDLVALYEACFAMPSTCPPPHPIPSHHPHLLPTSLPPPSDLTPPTPYPRVDRLD